MKKYLFQFKPIWLILAVLALGACTPKRNLVYFSDDKGENANVSVDVSKMIQESEPRIEPKDLLNIRVTTLSIESNAIFNNVINVDVFNTTTPELIKMGYRVGKDGNISFPVVGEVDLGGLTISQAETVMAQKLSGYTKNPIVNIDFLNFKVTVIGEVNHPGTFTVADENVTLLGALGYAGDLTPFAKRNNLLLVREVNGVRTTTRIDLTKSDLFKSPYYYLKQNDIIYVEPDKSKLQETNQANRFIPVLGSFMAVVAVIVGIAFSKK